MEPSSQEDSSESDVAMIEQQPVSCDVSDSESYSEDATAFNSTRRTEISLSLSPNYVKDWDTTAAFRELYQNWKDAIIESFNLDPASFRPVYQEDEQDIRISVATNNSPADALGFIKYEKDLGRVVMTNPCAGLEPGLLRLGQTTKQGKDQLAGCHGEGLKLAAMVMSREKYRVGIETNNARWTFYLGNTSRFCCIISPSRKAIPRRKPDPARDMANFVSRIWRDVTVVIGPNRKSRSQGVSVEQFKKWLEVSLEIHGFSRPESVIETDHGDLIFDPRFRGKVFLKGLLLPSCLGEARPFRLGYNFLNGRVNRDRQRLVSRRQEADLVRKIWESAIREHEELVLPIYVSLLREFPRAPDIELADRLLESSTRVLIWNYLLKEADGRKFYFCQRTGSQSVGTITRTLRKEPAGLPGTLWSLLRGIVPIRTADEEQVEMFRNATGCEPPKTVFAMTVQRALKASLALCRYPSSIEFVHSEDSNIAMLTDRRRNSTLINQKWLDVDAAHATGHCHDGPKLSANGPFSCDHIVEELFIMFQDELSKHAPSLMSYERRHREWRLLSSMPGSLRVTWEDGATESFSKRYGHQTVYHVVLHEERCAPVMGHLLHGETADLQIERAPCGCFQKLTSRNLRVVEFAHLDSAKKYFPMIAVNERGAFYGAPPRAILPSVTLGIDMDIHMEQQQQRERFELQRRRMLQQMIERRHHNGAFEGAA
ncbi:hypothetical protein IFM61392_09518 [Aspergillus lentulus]|nr:hypothetical protein IFM61392_09518 [Aspergillus lentulus]